jgi:hypothetical protein
MAKRFVDTGLGRKAWFRTLSPVMKCAWRFLTEECDCAGAWSIDRAAMEFHIGAPVDLDALRAAVNADGEVRLVRLGRDKLFLPGFVAFQYGELSPACKPHVPVLKRLAELGIVDNSLPFDENAKGYPKGFQTLKEKEKDKDKEKGEGGAGETQAVPEAVATAARSPNSTASPPVSADDVAAVREAWLDTLARFKAGRKNLLPEEEVLIARSIQRWGRTACLMAIVGKRYEPRGTQQGGYDPGSNLSLRRVLNHQEPDKFERLMNIGVKAHNERGVA